MSAGRVADPQRFLKSNEGRDLPRDCPTRPFGGNGAMTRAEFIQAKAFIFLDVEREIQLAKTDAAALRALGVAPGGGNFLVRPPVCFATTLICGFGAGSSLFATFLWLALLAAFTVFFAEAF